MKVKPPFRVLKDMSYRKFTSITGGLVARNGGAARALVSALPEPDCTLSQAFLEKAYARWRGAQGNESASANRPKARKLMVAMTDAEHEALAIIAAKGGLTRHQVVRAALNGYFKWLADEYGSTCHCISMHCANVASTFPRAPKRSH